MQNRTKMLQMCFQLQLENKPLPLLEYTDGLVSRALCWAAELLESNSSLLKWDRNKCSWAFTISWIVLLLSYVGLSHALKDEYQEKLHLEGEFFH